MTQNNSLQLLLHSLNKKAATDISDSVADAINNNIDLEYFFTTAKRHGVLPLIYPAWRDNCIELVQENIAANLKESVRLIGISNLGKVSALIQLLTLLGKHNIPAVPFKGPLLACSVYNDLSLRSFYDLDVLVGIHDVISVYEILRESGYIPEIELSRSHLKHLIRTEDNLNFIHSKSGVIVELHWELAGRCLPLALTLDLFESRLVDATILNHTVTSLGNEDLLIYLCIHGSKRIWSRLEWLYSVHELVRKNKNLNWKLIFTLAEQWSAKRMLGVGLLAARSLFETELPKKVLVELNSTPQATKMAQSVANIYLCPAKCHSMQGEHSRFTFWQLKCMDSTWARIRLILTMLFNPTIEDYRRFTFPGELCYLYYICRPFRLVWDGLTGK